MVAYQKAKSFVDLNQKVEDVEESITDKSFCPATKIEPMEERPVTAVMEQKVAAQI